MRLTKTQQELIDTARKHGGRYSVTRALGRGAHGGRIDHGSRQRDAMFALRAKGLIRIVDQQSDTDYNRGHAITCTSWAFELVSSVPADDQFLAALGPCGR